MKDKRCLICKCRKKNNNQTFPNMIFNKQGHSGTFYLCYSHSVDYFKFGQRFFFEKYEEFFNQSRLAASEADHAILDFLKNPEKEKYSGFWST